MTSFTKKIFFAQLYKGKIHGKTYYWLKVILQNPENFILAIWQMNTLTSDATKGASIPPTLAATEETPNPLLRTSVGNSSLVYT